MKRKILYALAYVLGAIVLGYLCIWAYIAWHGGFKHDAVTGTPNEDAQAIAEKIELNISEHAGECNYISAIKNLGYPKIVIGKDGRKYLANAFIRFEGTDLRLTVDVSGPRGENGWTGSGIDLCNFGVEGK